MRAHVRSLSAASLLFILSASVFAQQTAAVPPPLNSNMVLPPLPSKGPAGPVDDVLKRISQNVVPAADAIDAQTEIDINRYVALNKSVGAVLKPVGYVQIGSQRMIYASEDGKSVMRLTEGSRIGVMKIARISENGVDYQVGGKTFYAALAYATVEVPKAPQQNQSAALPQGLTGR